VALTATDSGTPNSGGNVTGDYTVTGQEPDILVQSGNRVVQAMTIYATETTFGIAYQFTIPLTVYNGEGPQVAAADRSSWLQTIGNHEHVVAVFVTQDVNPQNLLRDYVYVTVGDPAFTQTTQTRFLLDNANTPGAFALIDQAYANLVRASQPGTGV
jgi:hypothetical protein